MSANTSTNNASTLPDSARPRLLKVGGVTPFSATDFPGKLSAVIFVQGCPWRCGYCHNPHLQARPNDSPISWDKLVELLRRRIGLIDGVVFSGGESTIDPALPDAIALVRSLGFEIGLHTAGIYPQRLEEVLPLLDWVGLDIKAPFDDYARITGVPDSGIQALASARAILASGIKHEFRTTVHPALLDENTLLRMAQELSGMGVQDYALQVFRAQGCQNTALNAYRLGDYPSAGLVQQVSSLFRRFTLRQA